MVEAYFKGVSIESKDTRIEPKRLDKPFSLTMSVKPYQEQVEAVNACLKGHGTVSMPTGTGKSITMALLIARLQVKTLVIVPNLNLKIQLTETFKQLFGDLSNIIVENIDNPRLTTLKDFDCLIIDESHHVAAKTYRRLNAKAWQGIYHRYFFTATPYRTRSEEQLLMESIAGQVIYKLSYQDAVAKGLIVPVEAYYIDLPKTETDACSWREVYSSLVVHNKARNELIVKLLLRLRDFSTLCLVKEIAHGNNLSCDGAFLFAHAEAEDCQDLIDRFNSKALSSLIATIGVAGEGTDTRPCEYVLITSLGRSKGQFLQMVGRGVRRYPGKESCKVILFRDPSHKFTLKHFQAQVRILKEEFGIKPVKLEII